MMLNEAEKHLFTTNITTYLKGFKHIKVLRRNSYCIQCHISIVYYQTGPQCFLNLTYRDGIFSVSKT